MARRLSITDAQVWDRLERCYEEAITIEGRHSSLAEFLAQRPAEEVTAFFTDIVALLERRGIENYHLVLKNVEASSRREPHHRQQQQQQWDEERRGDGSRGSSTSGSSSGHGGGRGGMMCEKGDSRGRGGNGRRGGQEGRDKKDDGRDHRHCYHEKEKDADYHGRRQRDDDEDKDRRRRRRREKEEEDDEKARKEGDYPERGRGRGREHRSSRSRSRDRGGRRGGGGDGGRGGGGRGRGGDSSSSGGRSGERRGRSRSRSCSSRSSRSSTSSSSSSSRSSSSSSSSSSPPRPSSTPAPAGQAKAQWSIVVYYGGEARKDFSGPLAAASCMSCDLGTSMQTGLTGNGEGGLPAEASLIYEDAHMRYWHDAKGRPLFVVTPLRHVHNLKELTAAEMHQLWSGAVQILTDMGCDPKEDMRDMILNAGVDRNHAHLHLKVRVTGRGFDRARGKWSERRNRLVDALKAFARKQDC